MDFHRLRAFVVVAEYLNFRKSAEILGISQPPLTRLISSLEDELSTPLLERTTRQVKLTSAGMYLLKEGKEILSRLKAAESEVRAIGKIRSGHIAVGFSMTSFLARLPGIIDGFRERNPKLRLELHQGSRRNILCGVRDGSLDIGFVEGIVPDKGMESLLVRDEALGVLLPRKHPLAKRKEIGLAELESETIILHPRKEHHEFFDTIHQLFSQSGIAPKTYIKAEGESCPLLVSLGKGVILTIAGSQNKVPGQTRFVPLAKLQLPVSAAWLPENQNPLLKSFLSFVSENAVPGRRKTECLEDLMRI